MALRVVGAEPLGAGGGARSGGALSAGTHAQVKLTTKARFSFQSRGRDVFFGWFILDGELAIRKQAPSTAEAVTVHVDTHTQDALRGREESRSARRQPSRRRRRARSTQRCGVCARHTAAYGTWAPWPMRARPQVPRQGRAPLQRQRHDRPGLAFVLTLRRVWQSGTCSRVVLRCTLTNEAHTQRSVRETYDVLSSPWRWRRSPRLRWC